MPARAPVTARRAPGRVDRSELLNRATRSEAVYVGLATLIVVGGYVDAWAQSDRAAALSDELPA